jgi:ubiquinone/menaquinone biosynthesis C-methylase UbiE
MSHHIPQDWAETTFDDWYMQVEGDRFSAEQTQQEARRIARMLELKPGQAVLDLACGLGRHTLELARMGLGPITGLDFVPSYIEEARKRALAAGVKSEFVCADMRALDYEGRFDAVFNCFNSMFYWDDATNQDILARVHRALRPGGRLYLEVQNREAQVAALALRANRWARMEHKLRGLLGRARRLVAPRPTVRLAQKDHVLDLETGVLNGTMQSKLPDGTLRETPYQLRLYTLTEVKTLLAQVGLEYQSSIGCPDENPYRIESSRVAIVAWRR